MFNPAPRALRIISALVAAFDLETGKFESNLGSYPILQMKSYMWSTHNGSR